MLVGIFPNLKKKIVRNNLNKIISKLEESNIDFLIHSKDTKSKIEKNADILLILGGDGTFLKAFSLYKDKLPFLGINFGKFGFLSYLELSDFPKALQEIINENYKIGKRSFIKIKVVEDGNESVYFSLNEATLVRDISSRLIEVPVYINGVKIGPVPCDGIIISTPTGSTAYNLSAGGPVIHPHQDSMVISFMLSHSLFSRSLVLDSESSIEINMKSWHDKVFLIIDGREKIALNEKSIITISLSKRKLGFVETKDYNFIKILEKKFGWGKRTL